MGRAAELDITHLDTSDLYGNGTNEILVGENHVNSALHMLSLACAALMLGACTAGKAVAGRRSDYTIATKFGVGPASKTSSQASTVYGVHGDPLYVRKAVEDSLSRLGIQQIDLYYQHRVDRSRPIEETWACLKASTSASSTPCSMYHAGLGSPPPLHGSCAHDVVFFLAGAGG